ncbi:MAG: GGDEF domain-containing protein [Betaproteobacteria bacterium]
MKKNSGQSGAAMPAEALRQALGESEQVQELVEEAGKDLSNANEVLKEELATEEPPPAINDALDKSTGAEKKVQEASEKLAVVNEALANEVRERHVLEFHLAAATEQKEAAYLASLHDPLTGLPNRALFNDRLEHALAQAHRHDWHLAVMFIDLDNFKSINDTLGHAVGDRVLEIIAERLMESTRADDTLCRQGGDEFLYVMMEPRDERAVRDVAEKFIRAIETPCEVVKDGATVSRKIRASIGISLFPQDATTAEALVIRADESMYRAKREQLGYCFADGNAR